MKFGKFVVKFRIPILIIALILLIPSVLGMLGTRINYDMLNYLPDDMDTVIGQEALLEDFNKGAFSFVIVEDMPPKDVSALKEKIEQVEHVDTVLWYDSFADISVPMEMLPDELYNAFNTENATMMAIFFDTSTSSDDTMDAIREIRSIAGKQCFVSGMSALVTDLKDLCEKEEPIYVALAVVLACAAMMIFLDGWLVPFVFLASIGVMILFNLGSNYFFGEISYITKALSAVLQGFTVSVDSGVRDKWDGSSKTQPSGSGATCAYPHRDLMIRNDTDRPYQLCLRVGETHLEGAWRSTEPPALQFRVIEKDARIDQASWGGYIRHNQLWREVYGLSGALLEEQYLCTNDAIMMYSPLLSAAPADGE